MSTAHLAVAAASTTCNLHTACEPGSVLSQLRSGLVCRCTNLFLLEESCRLPSGVTTHQKSNNDQLEQP